jgi:hypothetical protein
MSRSPQSRIHDCSSRFGGLIFPSLIHLFNVGREIPATGAARRVESFAVICDLLYRISDGPYTIFQANLNGPGGLEGQPRYGIANFRVITVTPTRQRAFNLCEKLRKAGLALKRFWFSDLPPSLPTSRRESSKRY